MEIKQINKVLGSLGLKDAKCVGNTFKWSKKGGLAGAKKVVKTIENAKRVGFSVAVSETHASPGGSMVVTSTTLTKDDITVTTRCAYGNTADANDFAVYVRFSSIEL